MIGQGYAEFRNTDGKAVGYIGDKSKYGFLTLSNTEGTNILSLGPGSKRPGGHAEFFSPNGKAVVQIGASADNGGYANFYNDAGSVVLTLSPAGKKPGGFAQFFGPTGKAVAQIGTANDNGGFATFFDDSGAAVASIGTSPTGGGGVWIGGQQKLDVAEPFEFASRDRVAPGSVVSAAPTGAGIELSAIPYDRKVAGVISGAGSLNAGVRMGARKDGSADLPVAIAGQVYVRVCGESGNIEVGDLLVSSSRPGVAMRGADSSRLVGTVVGKALENWHGPESSEGLVRMLVMSR